MTRDDSAFCHELLSAQDYAMNIIQTSDRRESAELNTLRGDQHSPQGELDRKETHATGRGRSRIRPTTTSGKQPDGEIGRTKEATAPDPQTEEPQVPVTTQEATETPNQSGVLGAAGVIWTTVGGAMLLRMFVGESSRNRNFRHR